LIRFFYNLGIIVTSPLWKVATVFSPKVKCIVNGRKETKKRLKELNTKLVKRIWIHLASLGEFEMVLPLVDALDDSKCEFHFSFYSPSGYMNAKLPNNRSYKWYLLNDTKNDAEYWIKQLDPDLAVFVKYEFWLNHLKATNKYKVQFIYWNVLLRENHFLTKWFSQAWWIELMKTKKVFAQDSFTHQIFKDKGIVSEIIGDIRFLRSLQALNNKSALSKEWESELKKYQNIIFGSSWELEEQAAQEYLTNNTDNNIKLILVPHNIGRTNIQRLIKQFEHFGVLCYSNNKPECIRDNRILLVDSIGLLQSIYRLGSFAVVGGGFKNALHNIIEPLSCGLPVVSGDNTPKFPEAKSATASEALIQCSSKGELAKVISKLTDNSELLQKHKEFAVEYFQHKLPNLDNAFSYCRKLMTI